MNNQLLTVLDGAAAVLHEPTPAGKIASAERVKRLMDQSCPIGPKTPISLPKTPARPKQPLLVSPSEVPRRRLGTQAGRAALLHAICHIEFNAIDLAFDMAVRFAPEIEACGLDTRQFVADWVTVGSEEAHHFGLIANRLEELGFAYGDFPSHNALWEAAEATSKNLPARLVVAPLILEARGLDVTVGMIKKLRAVDDLTSATVLEIIYRDEIEHVACGKRWFHAICIVQDQDPVTTFHSLKATYFPGALRPPFNYEARDQAGMPREYYEPN